MLARKHNIWHTPNMAKTKKEWAKDFGRQGAKARAKALSPEQRKEIARKAAQARWAKAKGSKQ